MNICAMTDSNRDEPRLNSRAETERQKREARLAEALRENLRRRKAQKRGRNTSDHGPAKTDEDSNDG
jgi:hypothetical protein